MHNVKTIIHVVFQNFNLKQKRQAVRLCVGYGGLKPDTTQLHPLIWLVTFISCLSFKIIKDTAY